MKIFKGIGIFIVVLVAIYLVLGLFGPSDYKVTRSIKITAPIEVVFEQTSKFENWGAWSQWAKIDETAKYTIENDNQEIGAKMSWESNHQDVGHGSMTISEIVKNEKTLYTLKFVKPWEFSSNGGFLYTQEEASVNVEWYDSGDIPFVQRPIMLFMNLEAQIGPMFEKGLANVKTICEEIAAKPSIQVFEETVDSKSILYISESSPIMSSAIGIKMGTAFGEILSLVGLSQLEMIGVPMSITRKFSIEEMKVDFDPAIAVREIPAGLELSGRIQKGETYSGKALKTVHVGSYDKLKSTYDAFIAHINQNGYEINGDSWEEYIDDPTKVSSEEVRTNIYFPVK